MRIRTKIALVTGAFALSLSPAALAVGKPEGVPPGKGAEHAHGGGPTYTPGEGTRGPKEGLPPNAKAYGRNCKGESKQHVKGEKGTAFSRCVKSVVALRHQERKEEKATT